MVTPVKEPARYISKQIRQGALTLAIIKPVGMAHKDYILQRIKEAGFSIVYRSEGQKPAEFWKRFYSVHKDRDFYEGLVQYMASGETLALILYHPEGDATKLLRDIAIGPGGIREFLGVINIDGINRNKIHSSDSAKSAKSEIFDVFEDNQENLSIAATALQETINARAAGYKAESATLKKSL